MFKILTLIVGLFTSKTDTQTGVASWYSVRDNGGRHTSSGIKLDDSKLTCAHKRLKNGTLVKITNLKNGKSVVCKVTDYFPGTKGRLVDCSVAVAKKLDFYKAGLTKVSITVL